MIGRGGVVVKEAGTQAREELEALFGTRVHCLDVSVKVEKDWQRRAHAAGPSRILSCAPCRPRGTGAAKNRSVEVAAGELHAGRVPTRWGYDVEGPGLRGAGPLEGDMTPRRSGGRRLVLVAATVLAVGLTGCGSEMANNRQNTLEPRASYAHKIYDLFWPIGLIVARSSASPSSSRPSSSPSSSGTGRARTRTPSRSTATPGSRSAGRSCPRSSWR